MNEGLNCTGDTPALYVMVGTDALGAIQWVSPSVEAVFGWKVGEITSQPFNVLLPESHQSQYQSLFTAEKENFSGVPSLLEACRKDGETFLCEFSLSQIHLEPSQQPQYYAVFRDLSQVQQTEQQTKKRVERLQKLSELSMMLAGDPLEVFAHIANMISELLDIHIVCLSEIRGEELHFLSVFSGGQILLNSGQCQLTDTPCKSVQTEQEMQIYDGVAEKFPQAEFLQEHRANFYCGFPVFDSAGEVIAVACLLDERDRYLTEEDKQLLHILGQRIGIELERHCHSQQRQLAEEQARQDRERLTHVSRLITLGELVTGIAHELNQPLTAIANYSDTCKELLLSESPPSHEHLADLSGKVADQAVRCGKIIRRMRNLGQKTVSQRELVNLNDLIQEAVDLADPEAMLSDIQLRVEPGKNLPMMLVDKIQIQQVILNLIRNACDIFLEKENGPREVILRTSMPSESAVEIRVEDSGSGLPVEDPEQLFEAFFSTKREGMGLGLAISRTIIEAHDGHLSAESGSSGGAIFKISLPVRNIPGKTT